MGRFGDDGSVHAWPFDEQGASSVVRAALTNAVAALRHKMPQIVELRRLLKEAEADRDANEFAGTTADYCKAIGRREAYKKALDLVEVIR